LSFDLVVGFVIILFILVVGLIQCIRDSSDLADHNKNAVNRHLDKLERKSGLSKRDIRYFTTGHPYVWVEVERVELLKMLQETPAIRSSEDCCVPVYSVKLDARKSRIFIVIGKSGFDFEKTKLVTYEEYTTGHT